MIQLLAGDCRDVLPTLAADSVQCCVCSPPYYALRSYLPDGHADKPREIGSEATPEAYLATMVAVFREVRRVLRPDGTCWVNLGSSYSNGKGSNVTDQLNRLIEGGSVFFTNAGSVAVTGHGVGIALKHERAPDGELSGLLAAQRDGIEQRHQHLGKVADLFAGPGSASPRPASTGVLGHMPDTEIVSGEHEHRSVIASGSDTQPQAILSVLRASGAVAGEDDETTLAIHQADEPRIGGNVRWQPTWQAFACEALRKGVEDIHSVNDTIALGNRLHTVAGLLCDFRVAKASEKQITLASIHGGLTLAISDVRQLWFVLRCGSIVPYHKLLGEASRFANALLPKQDLGMPWRVARALQEDGWILRSPIIWHKPNPMPESTRDRPTSAHEHVFLLTKRSRYYYDADAVREPHVDPDRSGPPEQCISRGGMSRPSLAAPNGREYNPAGRSCRNVWTIATHAYPQAHFATYPPELAERCIRAGTRRGDTVLDPFAGAGTTLLVADRLQRDAIGIELSPDYTRLAMQRCQDDAPLFTSFPPAETDAQDERMRDLFREAAD